MMISRHAANRRLTAVGGVQTKVPELALLNAEFVLRSNRLKRADVIPLETWVKDNAEDSSSSPQKPSMECLPECAHRRPQVRSGWPSQVIKQPSPQLVPRKRLPSQHLQEPPRLWPGPLQEREGPGRRKRPPVLHLPSLGLGTLSSLVLVGKEELRKKGGMFSVEAHPRRPDCREHNWQEEACYDSSGRIRFARDHAGSRLCDTLALGIQQISKRFVPHP